MVVFLQNIISGLETGALYALAALGLVLIFKTSDVINFAQGDMAMFSAFVAYRIFEKHVPYWGAVIGALVFAAVFGYIIERLFLRPAVKASIINKLIITMGLVMVVQGLAVIFFGTEDYYLRKAIESNNINVDGVIIQPNAIFIIVLILAIVFIFNYLVKKTKFGISIRATAEKDMTARMMGIPVSSVYSRSWMIATALGALAGILVAPKTQVSVTMMADIHMKSFIAAVVGGFSSFIGPVAGGFIMGIADNMVGYYISLDWKTVIVYGFLIVMLLVKPAGLFGEIIRKKV
ncbi:high-affinity branched-chain amino acid transport system permease protein LivH [Clostridium homopropionicum DSM 5847]|uniref:High-affinity branched-chain amino acid transport system permease protein LivH n=1 Tax=Clostridium homopropionicum DSM 5847 TaxID=1121318 RepID=A0A0L6ZBL8_9CLOT|nr:branched-chain amino acid ABC transporter permease [Clostridium homopropionicum]KOA20379.1 high-affinity branched-chain amino acid transport system permease protein LivH [Clostridium homopropionicum DSM 5847]SFG74630.1 amino acid/amide ABC transporter membrane protein 1, HAAT family [Clostridium homopropionicum]